MGEALRPSSSALMEPVLSASKRFGEGLCGSSRAGSGLVQVVA